MPKPSSRKKSFDINQIAASILGEATGTPTPKSIHEKNPAAVALGRLGGLKGGKARAQKLSASRRKEIARKAALSRWANKQKPK